MMMALRSRRLCVTSWSPRCHLFSVPPCPCAWRRVSLWYLVLGPRQPNIDALGPLNLLILLWHQHTEQSQPGPHPISTRTAELELIHQFFCCCFKIPDRSNSREGGFIQAGRSEDALLGQEWCWERQDVLTGKERCGQSLQC